MSRLVPTRLALAFLAAWLVLGIAAAALPDALVAWQVLGVLAAAALIADALAGVALAAAPAIERRVAHNLAVGQWSPTELRLTAAPRRTTGWLTDAFPDAFDATALPRRFSIVPGQAVLISYRVRPLERGNHRYGRTRLRI